MIDVKVSKKTKTADGGGKTYVQVSETAGYAEKSGYASKAAKADKATFAEQADYAVNAGTASRASYADKAGDIDDGSPLFDKFLSSTEDDVAAGLIRFNKGIKVGSGNYGLDENGAATLGETTTGNLTATAATIEGDTTTTNLTVTGKATFFELEIQKASAAGGLSIYSAGTCKIDYMPDRASGATTAYRCYMLAEDSDGNAIQQMVKSGDLLVSADFNVKTSSATGSTYSGAANHFWWRRVTGAPSSTYTINGRKYYLITLSYSDCASGSDAPQVGDVAMVLGSKSTAAANAARKNAIIVCAHSGIDSGLSSPYIAQYVGINDYDLPSFRKSWWGYDSDHNASNHFTGSFTIGSTETPIVRDLGEYISGQTYEYYDRVSYKGSLYLMTNKDAGSTTQPPTGSDWTLQVSKGAQGESGASISIKGNAVAHYATIAAIPSTAEGEYLVDTCTEMGETRRRVIATMSGGSYVACEVAEDGDSYITSDDGHLWTAAAGSTTWVDCGKIQGEKGADGAQGATGAKGAKGDKGDKGDQGSAGADGVSPTVYSLVPVTEILYAERVRGTTGDGLGYSSTYVKGTLRYNVRTTQGATITETTPTTAMYWRWKPTDGDTWNNIKANIPTTVYYLYNKGDFDPTTDTEIPSDTITVELLDSSGNILDRNVVRVSMTASAYASINTELGEVEAGVTDWRSNKVIINTSLTALRSSYTTVQGELETKAEVSTSVQYDPDTGKVTSAVKLSANNITLEGAVTANKDFKIDTWGNVMTGVQVNQGAGTSRYIVEDRSNLVFDKDATILLPNDPEFIGRRILLIVQPKSNSAGAVVRQDGTTAATNISQTAQVTAKTGEVYLYGVYSQSNGAAIYEDAPTDEVYNGVRRFGGSIVGTSGGYIMQPLTISIRSGYMELLGVPYSVSNTVRAEAAVLGGEKYSVQITRSEDGKIDDSATDNGTVLIEETAEADSPLYVEGVSNGTPWKPITQLCQWVVINTNAADVAKTL